MALHTKILTVPNLKERKDVNQSLTEVVYYDDLHRFEHSTLNGNTNLTLTYNGTGGILSKTSVGTYTYHATKIHAVSSINTGSGTWSYTYDANGNMTSRNGTEILWYADNLPKRIRKTPGSSTDSSEFQYGPSGLRWKHDYRKGSTLYSHVYVGSLLEKVTEGSNVEWKHHIHANGDAVAVYERHSSGTNSTYYLLKDHLGSTDVVANSSGAVFVRESFDAYGRRRGTNWTGNPTATEINNMNTSTRRGFTFHEQLDSTDLVHLDGRVYDPLIGRFVSADPTVPYPLSTQSFNRYSYAQNNPLSRIDPSGFDDLGIQSWSDDMNNEDLEARLMANILALFEAAMANGGDMPNFSAMSGMQRAQYQLGGFRGANGPVQMIPVASNVQQFGSGYYTRIPGTSAEHGGTGYGADGVADMGGVEFAPSRMVRIAGPHVPFPHLNLPSAPYGRPNFVQYSAKELLFLGLDVADYSLARAENALIDAGVFSPANVLEAGGGSRLLRPQFLRDAIKFGRRMVGREYPTKPRAGGGFQPWDPKTGRYLPYSANPGFSLSPLGRFGHGVAAGYADSKGVPYNAPLGRAGGAGFELGRLLGIFN